MKKRCLRSPKCYKQNQTISKLLKKCSNLLTQKTLKYSKSQIKWIRNRLLNERMLKNRILKFQIHTIKGFDKDVVEPCKQAIENFIWERDELITTKSKLYHPHQELLSTMDKLIAKKEERLKNYEGENQ